MEITRTVVEAIGILAAVPITTLIAVHWEPGTDRGGSLAVRSR